MSPFQFAVTALFGVFTLLGVAVFAVFGGLGGSGGIGPVTVWGTVSAPQMDNLLIVLRAEDKALQEVTYVEKGPSTYYNELVSAMAAGTGPDLFFISHEDMGLFADKVLPLPYDYISERAFTSAFVDEGRLFLSAEGSLALPLLIDPLVMYWNRDLFASGGVASAPKYWNDFLTIAPKITSHDAASAVSRSAVALGEWRNIANAKGILSALLLQAGDPIVSVGSDGAFHTTLGTTPEGSAESPAQSALRFYTEFANPSKAVYSWNRAMPEAQSAFIGGQVGAYFGYASEYKTLRERNPNLSIGVETLPQIQGSSVAMTFGKLTGVAIARTTQNAQGAAAVAQRLSGPEFAAALAGAQSLPSVRRDTAIDTTADAAAAVFAQSALMARGWPDPSPAETNVVFQAMIESVSSGRSTPAEAVGDAALLMEQLLRSERLVP